MTKKWAKFFVASNLINFHPIRTLKKWVSEVFDKVGGIELYYIVSGKDELQNEKTDKDIILATWKLFSSKYNHRALKKHVCGKKQYTE